ncbi:hypothetical protein EUTSA_v10010168mg [Eutrema salsugineum]|uniref:Pentacotripeptide-repeat region of PRORP domain-containing protein n=1 Tax=Eutrema salsugineum TaxID=72664 RepID=V4NHE9_EUTSA|nr:pentatricopeptide repeat-containing protein At4g20090 [Eutrema salsugineum]ESQ45601.1 hypothetical protein EUTSA_v10010168mg [Eutrema salsugineum]
MFGRFVREVVSLSRQQQTVRIPKQGFKQKPSKFITKCPFPIRISFFSYFLNKSRILSSNPVKLSIHLLCFSSSVSVSPKPSMETEQQHTENPSAAPISEKMFESAPKMGSYKLGDSTLSSMIENYANSGDFASVEKLLSRIRLENRMIREHSFIVLFRAYGKAHLPEKTIELFHRMVDEFQCKRTIKSFNSVLNVIINEGRYHRGLEFYDYVVNSNMNIAPNGLSFNLVIKAMCKLGFVDRAIEVFRVMPEKKCVPDGYTYCTLMDGLCKEERIDEAVLLLDEMQSEGCSPSSVTYNVLIDGLCKKGDLTRVTKLVDNMFLKGCVPNKVTYNTLIHGLCLKGKLDKAVSLLERMVSSKCIPNDVTYGTLINGLVKQRRAMDGAGLLISMEERGYRLNQHVYSILISGLFKEGKVEEAMSLWKKMGEKGCQPNIVVYSALVDGLCRQGKTKEAKEIFDIMISNGCLPNVYTYSSLMKGFFKTGLSEEAIQVWREMDNTECSRNKVCYSVLIDGLCGVGRVKEAMMVWSKMLIIGIKPDTVAYSSMIKGFCGIGSMDAAIRLYHEMLCQEDHKSQPDVVTYNIIIDGFCMQKDISRAVDLLNCMLDRGCDPDAITCDTFLKTLSKKSDSCEEGKSFLEELVVRLLKRQRVSGACKIVEVMLSKYLTPKASTWAMIVPEICKPKKINVAIDKCWRNMCT